MSVCLRLGHTYVQYSTVLYCTVPYCTVQYRNVLYCTVQYCTVLCHTVLYSTVLYCTVLYHTVTSLADTHLLIKQFMLGPLDKKFYGGWWHCNYSYKLQGSRGDLEILSLVELDSRPIESNFWTPSLSILYFWGRSNIFELYILCWFYLHSFHHN